MPGCREYRGSRRSRGTAAQLVDTAGEDDVVAKVGRNHPLDEHAERTIADDHEPDVVAARGAAR